jgi:regulator of RNase E activity RraB
MDDVNRTPTKAAARGRKPKHRNQIVAAVERAETDRVVAELGDAGFDPDRIYIITAEDMQALDESISGTGVRGFLRRLNLSLGDELDEYEQAERELEYGHALVMVGIQSDAEQDRAYDVLRRRGGHGIRYYGRWTITALENGDP